jgi:hypothetical protein
MKNMEIISNCKYKENDIYMVKAEDMIQLAVFYLCRRYKDAFDYLDKKFSFLMKNTKQPIDGHATIRKIIKNLVDNPYLDNYLFVMKNESV